MSKNEGFADELLKSLFEHTTPPKEESLKDIFDNRIKELGITATNALDILQVEYRTLNGILKGSQKRVDFTVLLKLAQFLNIPRERVISLYLDSLEQEFTEDTQMKASTDKIGFIKENFDLESLRKVGFVKSTTDFADIESRVTSFFGLKSITDFKACSKDVAFSQGARVPKDNLNRSVWIYAAEKTFKALENPYDYNRENLVDFFPNLRWHSMDVDNGLPNVIQALYRLGVTVIYQPSLPSLHLRGATFSVNDKPCIVITNYVGFYATLWFALIHELFHVIFDWEEISKNRYHLSNEDNDDLTLIEKEMEADDFAREYLFSKEKTESVKSLMNDDTTLKKIAAVNHIHSSFIYVFHAFDVGKKDKWAWARARRHTPPMEHLLSKLGNDWDSDLTIDDFTRAVSKKLYKQP